MNNKLDQQTSPAGIKDVARAAGVSPATVSRALSGGPVSAELRKKVEKAVKAIGYRPNLSARRLRSQNTKTIGLVVADIRNPFFTAVSRVVEDMAYAQGMRVVLCNTDENPEREAFYLRSMQEERVTGLILAPTETTLHKLEKDPLLEVPVVMVDRYLASSRYDAVALDNVQAARVLVEHLIASGKKRIAGLFGNSSRTGQERYQGYAEAVTKAGLPVLGQFIRPYTSDAESALRQLWASEKPDAIIASNSLTAGGILRAVKALKLRIPEDLAVAAFDNEPWASLVEPGLTVIAQPVDDIGHAAMQLLSDRIQNPGLQPRTVMLGGELIVRGSSATG
ncbi:substrate-binding domain-containing protein [Rhizomicrobium palustre]|nr:LacI family DNA-binding transcriptional regulator [Rhizomicrobium palustre]